jgi:SulP family sulfate permease
VVGVESVPDGLARGLLAGINPVAGLYGHLFGMVGGALFTSTALMSIQTTGAMAIVVADVDLASRPDPGGSLVTLTVLTGVAMIVAGAARLGSALRFVSTSVTTGFVAAVGINIVLDQLGNLTGYAADGADRIARTVDVVLHPGRFDLPSLAVGLVTVALIVGLQRTRLGALGMVVAIVVGSAAAAAFTPFAETVAVVGDVADVPSSLPGPSMPAWRGIIDLILPAVSLAFVGLVQGAGVSAGVPNPDGTPADASQDFVAQGAGNVVSGMFQGMPVGGSMSASALAVNAGARTRASMLFSGVVMALVIVTLAGAVQLVAMPALGGLLIVVGIATVKPAKIRAVARTGPVPLTVMTVTLVLTLLVPLQYAVLIGVGISVLLFVIGQSSRLVTRRVVFEESGARGRGRAAGGPGAGRGRRAAAVRRHLLRHRVGAAGPDAGGHARVAPLGGDPAPAGHARGRGDAPRRARRLCPCAPRRGEQAGGRDRQPPGHRPAPRQRHHPGDRARERVRRHRGRRRGAAPGPRRRGRVGGRAGRRRAGGDVIGAARVVAAVALVVAAAAHMLRHRFGARRPRPPDDPHWGDWPPDQMAP